MPEAVSTSCPYCGEPIQLLVDAPAGSADYVEDCPVCCSPMQVHVEVERDAIVLHVRTGDE